MAEVDNLEIRNKMSYSDQAAEAENDALKLLYQRMEEKETNLILANDNLDFENFIPMLEMVAPHICMVKTHVDLLKYPRLPEGYKQEIFDAIERGSKDEAMDALSRLKPMDDYISQTIGAIQDLSEEHGLLIFEDRKFADIGKIVLEQATGGAFNIMDWAHFVNAHSLPGPGIIKGLYEAAQPYLENGEPRALIMLTHMTPEGNLFTEQYAKDTIEMMEGHTEPSGDNFNYAVGHIAGGSQPEKVKNWVAKNSDPIHLIAAPGTKFKVKDRKLGQRYSTPEVVIGAGADALIVGSGIYEAKDPVAEAIRYKDAGWQAYRGVKRIG